MSQVTYTLPSSPHAALWPDLQRVSGTAADGERWHAVYTVPRHEKSLARHLELRQIEHFLPVYSTRRKWRDGSNVTLDLPLFPGYIFVRIPRAARTRVLASPGALYLVGGLGLAPAEIPSMQIEALRDGLAKDRTQPHPLLTVGQRVRITRGALAGVEGVLQRLKSGLRVVITLELIMQSVAVEVEMSDIELIKG